VSRFAVVLCILGGCAQGGAALDAGIDAVDATVVDAAPDVSIPDGCVPMDEVCNFADDDCDGQADEGFNLGMPCDGDDDTDACEEGHWMCGAGGAAVCDDTTGSTVEMCNDVDDDCQNGIDDPFDVGQPCTVGVGACAVDGMKICDNTQTGTTCDATAGLPSAELCGNNIDENCDGADATCPANDVATGAIDISAGGTFTVDLTTAHDDNFAATTPQLDCGGMGGRDAFYQFTLPAEEVVYWDTLGSNFDSVVRVYSGACTAIGATPQACSDDQCSTTRSQGAMDLAAGTYCLVVDQFSSSTTNGAATLTFLRGGRKGIALPAASGTVTGTTTGGSNLSVASCEPQTNQPDVGHFTTTCSGSHTINASTCTGTAFDTILVVRTGSAMSTDIKCSDDVQSCGNNLQSKIVGATVSGPNLQWIIVDGFGQTGNGNYSLTYSVQ
jgi:hypothetical protein